MDAKIISTKNRKAQVTLFVIMALVILAVLLLFVALPKIKIPSVVTKISDPSSFIEQCIAEAGKKAVNLLIENNGYLEAPFHILYQDKKVPYLCYNKNFYQPCIPQNPLFIQHLEKEITSYVKPKISACFDSLALEAEKKGDKIELGAMEIKTNLGDKVNIIVNRNLKLSHLDAVSAISQFRAAFSSPLYSLASLAGEIVAQEARFCNFEYLGYMILHPQFKIEKTQVGSINNQSIIYKIKDKKTNQAMALAVKGCSLPQSF